MILEVPSNTHHSMTQVGNVAACRHCFLVVMQPSKGSASRGWLMGGLTQGNPLGYPRVPEAAVPGRWDAMCLLAALRSPAALLCFLQCCQSCTVDQVHGRDGCREQGWEQDQEQGWEQEGMEVGRDGSRDGSRNGWEQEWMQTGLGAGMEAWMGAGRAGSRDRSMTGSRQGWEQGWKPGWEHAQEQGWEQG